MKFASKGPSCRVRRRFVPSAAILRALRAGMEAYAPNASFRMEVDGDSRRRARAAPGGGVVVARAVAGGNEVWIWRQRKLLGAGTGDCSWRAIRIWAGSIEDFSHARISGAAGAAVL